jgi:hypothetical protein
MPLRQLAAEVRITLAEFIEQVQVVLCPNIQHSPSRH